MTARNRTKAPATPNRPEPTEAPKAERTRVTKPVIDYGKLTATEETALPKGTRSSALDGTPFPGWVADSRKRGVALSVTVPADAEKQTVYLIRQAAAQIDGTGVRIVADAPKDGNVKITFQAKDKRVNKRDAK
jgi:hypothetical protein